MASINLQKFGIVPDDEDNHVFTFIFENPQKLLEVKSLESSEVNYGGHRWSLVCMRKEERYMGIFLKWKYTDGQSSTSVSTKAKYSICLVHRNDYGCNKYFNSSQKFTSSQALLGKSKFIPLGDLLDYATGYLDETGKRVILELSMSRSSTRFEKIIDISPKSRTRKNASGYYFDTQNFVMANHRWYLRIYPTKLNSNGLPAAYLYLSSKPRGINLDLQFRLYIGQDTTESLSYNFGEGAKFDGFGKTLPHPLYNLDRTPELIVGVEIESVLISKDILVNLKPQTGVYTPHLYNRDYNTPRAYKNANSFGTSQNNLIQNDAFQDMEGNYWKVDLKREAQSRVTMVFDKGVHHFPQNKTKLLCWTSSLLSRDPSISRDIDMNGDPLVGYFSNFIDEKGFIMTFPTEINELEDRNSLYTTDNGEIVVRVNMLSLQTLPVGLRSVPRFEYQGKHLLRARRITEEALDKLMEAKYALKILETRDASSFDGIITPSVHDNRLPSSDLGDDIMSSGSSMSLNDCDVPDGYTDGSFRMGPVNFLRKNTLRASALSIQSQWRVLQEKEKNLESMREMSASRASLSMLDLSRDDRPMSESSGSDIKAPLYKSYDNLDSLSTPDVMQNGNMFEDDISKGFFSDVLHHMSNLNMSPNNTAISDKNFYTTSRDVYHGAREDLSTESGVAMSDDTALFIEARPSPMDLNKQKEVVEILCKFFQQRMPLRVTEVLEFGSLGSGTTTRSRMDVDLVLFSPDLPRESQEKWMPCLLHAISKHVQNASSNPDPFYPIPKCSYFSTTANSVQFTCSGVDVDVMVTYDWSNEDSAGYDALYNLSCKQTTIAGRYWHSLATARLQKKFISEQPNEVKELIKVIKHWRNCVQWQKTTFRPNSYLLSLLVIKAVEETQTVEMRAVMEKIGKYVMTPELKMAWSKFYLPEKFPVEFDPPTPLVRDPANPGFNVAETLCYWGQFRTEFSQWLKGLGMNVNWGFV